MILRVAVILFSFNNSREKFYNALRVELGKRFHVNVFFHHNDIETFLSILSSINAKYGMYIVDPIPSNDIKPALKRIPPEKLLIVDQYLDLGPGYSYVSHEFKNFAYEKLVCLIDRIQEYKNFILLYRENAHCPQGMLDAFQQFLVDHKVRGGKDRFNGPSKLSPGTLYFIISDDLLWEVLWICKQEGYIPGKNIGILGYNDNLAMRVVFDGITTITTDFKTMARHVTNYIKQREKTQLFITPQLIIRNSV